jgi:hypothetical protein
VSRRRAVRPDNSRSIPGVGSEFRVLQTSHTGSGTHAASEVMATVGLALQS